MEYGMFIVASLLISLIFTLSGLLLWKRPPKKINWFYGYRSKRSMKDQESWEFANRYFGEFLMSLSMVTALPFAIPFIILTSIPSSIASCIIGIIILIGQIILQGVSIAISTEKELKELNETNKKE